MFYTFSLVIDKLSRLRSMELKYRTIKLKFTEDVERD